MNKLSTLFLSLGMAMATSFGASADDFTLGYAHGDNTNATALEYSDNGATASAAIHISADFAKTMSGDKLNAVSFYVQSRVNMTSCKVWVRESLDGPNVAESSTLSLTSIYNRDWNKVSLTSPYTISDKGFYIGVTWEQKNQCKIISYIPTLCPDASWTQAPGKAWNNTDIQGTLCIDGLVSGDKRCGFDAMLVNASIFKYFSLTKGSVSCDATVMNQGTKQIEGLTFEVGIEGLDPVAITSTDIIPAGQKAVVTLRIEAPITGLNPDKYNVNYIKITKLGNGTDEFLANNELKDIGSFSVVERTFAKRVLIDEFTGEWCPNCPAGAELIHQVQEYPTYAGKVDALCHHVGDDFEIPEGNGLQLLYNLPARNNYIFCPGFAVDRVSVESTENGKKYTAPVFFPDPVSIMTDLLDQQVNEASLIGVYVDFNTPEADATKLEVSCTVKRVSDILQDNGRLTVYLVEDNVKPVSQAGANASYLHQNVTRAANSTWGEPIIWNDDNEFTFTYEFTLKPEYDLQNLRVQAVVTEYETMKYGNGVTVNWDKAQVYNTNYRKVSDGYTPGSGITNNVIDKNITVKAIYDLNGVQHNDFVKGVNIVIMSDGSTRKILK